MRLFYGIAIGLTLGNWLNGPEATARGLAAGAWTREALGLTPLERPMPYRRFEERAAIADTLQEGFECSPFDADQAAQAVQELVDKHRGGEDIAFQLEAARNRYNALYEAVLRWSESPREKWSRADMELDEAAGISFPLSPRDDDS